MIKYTTTDIIKRALQLADLENSDFISDHEKVSLLNESYQQVYQKLIDANDLSYIKHLDNVQDGFELPPDFWQLKSIYVTDSWGNKTRLMKNETEGYTIQNNLIRLHSAYGFNRYTNVELDYFPVPQTLTVKGAIQDSPFPENCLAACHTMYAEKTDDDTVIIRDLSDSQVEKSIGSFNGLTDIAIYGNAIVLVRNDKQKIINLDNGLEFELNQDERLVYYKEKIYVTDGSILKTIGGTVLTTGMNLSVNDDSFFVIDEDDNYHELRKTKFDDFDIPEHQSRIAYNKGLYIVTNGKELIKITDKVEFIPTDWTPEFIVSEKSVVTKRGITQNYYVESLEVDTVLDYPNSLFYIVVAYMLALAFKNKQGADVSQLSVLYEKAAAQFFDQLGNDNNSFYKIENMYRNR